VLKQIRSFEGNNRNARVFGYLRKVDPYVFEELILSCFEEVGYQIKRNKRYTGDGGIDGRLFRDGKIYLVQVKRYAKYIAKEHVNAFAVAVQENGADTGYFVHTGKTGAASKEWQYPNIKIISGEKLLGLLNGTAP